MINENKGSEKEILLLVFQKSKEKKRIWQHQYFWDNIHIQLQKDLVTIKSLT